MNKSDSAKLDIELIVADLTKWIDGEESLVRNITFVPEMAAEVVTLPKTEPPIEPEQKAIPEQDTQKSTVEKPKRNLRIWKIICYTVILFLLNVVLIYNICGANNNLPGFAIFSIRSQSMQDTIPQNSLIVTTKTAASDIKIGDVITFHRVGEELPITHKVTEVLDGVALGDKPSFRTKGTANAAPDNEIVYARDLVGKVAFHIPVIGGVLDFIAQNLILTLAIILTLIAAIVLVAWIRR